MKTQNLDLLLLEYNQSQKEVVANEWFATTDALFSRYVLDFVDILPENVTSGVYIISDKAGGELSKYKGYLAFYLNGWRYLLPKNGFIFFVEARAEYFIFKDGAWKRNFYNMQKFIHSGGDVTLDIASCSNFEIEAKSNTKIIVSCNSECSARVEIRVCYDSAIMIDWCESVIFSENLELPSINKEGGVSFSGYYSCKHSKFVVDRVSFYVTKYHR